MSTFDDLTAELTAIGTTVTQVKQDVDKLLAALAAVPPAGLTPQQQAALDQAVATARGIESSLTAIDTEVNPPAAAPVVSSITPSSGPVVGGTNVTILGTGFTKATSATIGGTAITNFTVSSDTLITGVTAAGTGQVAVVVTSPAGVSDGAVTFSFA